jgi:protocatechuate 3,4-dioxygenase beta subunit
MHARLRRPAVALITITLAASVLGIAPAANAIPMGLVSGTVSSGGAPAVGVEVTAYSYDAGDDYWYYVDDASTGATGAYTFDLPEGEYRLGFQDFDGRYVEEFYDNAPDVESPQAVTITADDATPVVANADLQAAAHITGTVLGTGAAPVEDIRVTAWREVVENPGTPDEYVDYWFAGRGYTNELGSYDVGGLPGGTFRIEFEDTRVYEEAEYATEYYDDQPSLYGDGTADLVVAPATTRGDINATLGLDSEIAGTVTDADGDPLQDAEVDVQTKVGSRWQYVAYATTDINGDYEVEGLRSGSYRVRFNADLGDDRAVEWWKNVGLRVHATDVVLGPDATVPLIDAQLIVGEHDDEVGPELVSTAPPTISGAPVVGQTLTATSGAWGPVAPTEFYYDWFRDGEYVEGSSSPTYVLTAADLGKAISVGVYAGDPDSDYGFGYAESAAVGPVAAAPVVTPPVVTPPVAPPVVDVPAGLAAVLKGVDTSGKPQVGKTIKVTGLDAMFRASTAVSYTFKWYAGKKAIKKATKSKLKITRAMKGKVLSVKVTAKASSTSRSVKLKVGKVK